MTREGEDERGQRTERIAHRRGERHGAAARRRGGPVRARVEAPAGLQREEHDEHRDEEHRQQGEQRCVAERVDLLEVRQRRDKHRRTWLGLGLGLGLGSA